MQKKLLSISDLPDGQGEVHGGDHGKAAGGDHDHEDLGKESQVWIVKQVKGPIKDD